MCGSGVIDAIAQLWQTGAIDYRGHLQAGEPRVRQGESGKEYLLVEAKDTGHGKDIVITQQDISEVQLAKAAVAASIKTLVDACQIQLDDEIGELVLAGAFGSYLDVDSSDRNRTYCRGFQTRPVYRPAILQAPARKWPWSPPECATRQARLHSVR